MQYGITHFPLEPLQVHSLLDLSDSLIMIDVCVVCVCVCLCVGVGMCVFERINLVYIIRLLLH